MENLVEYIFYTACIILAVVCVGWTIAEEFDVRVKLKNHREAKAAKKSQTKEDRDKS